MSKGVSDLIPDWVPDASFYQIFPDRFANGDRGNDPLNVQAWGAAPTLHGFQGGDLQGIMDRFDYLQDLGINALYLTPIFEATSNHRYNTRDFYRIDPKLGDLNVFQEFLRRAHARGWRVILDGVFNHCGRGFFAFDDVLENETNSPYKDWFHIKGFPLDAYGPGKAERYLGWWGHKELPKFNIANPEVRTYLLDVGRYWIEQGIDGWRLDVPNEIKDDSFWAEFRTVVKTANPEAYLLGEIWEIDAAWTGPGRFDGLMNYPFRDAVLSFILNPGAKADTLADHLNKLLEAYPERHNQAHYLPLGSHDTRRLLTRCGGDARKVNLCSTLQYTFPGAPALYYGDEVGLTGGKDPDNRRAFPWEEGRWNTDIRCHIKDLVRLRGAHPELRRGKFSYLPRFSDRRVFTFSREGEHRTLVVVVNASDVPHRLLLDAKAFGKPSLVDPVQEAITGQSLLPVGERLEVSLSPYQAVILVPSP